MAYAFGVQVTAETEAFDRGVRPILRLLLPRKARAIIEFRPDFELRRRIEQLAEKSTEGQLTKKEKAEYEGYVRANKFVAILQRQARNLVRNYS